MQAASCVGRTITRDLLKARKQKVRATKKFYTLTQQSVSCGYSRQSCSSDLSLQSSSPSHFQFKWMHSPLLHWNSWAAQVLISGGLTLLPHFSVDSSELSAQSGWLSQTHISRIHKLLLHWNSLGLQVSGGHFLSSLPSPQSSSPSHTKIVAMQVLLLHWNSLEEQTLEQTKRNKERGV